MMDNDKPLSHDADASAEEPRQDLRADPLASEEDTQETLVASTPSTLDPQQDVNQSDRSSVDKDKVLDEPFKVDEPEVSEEKVHNLENGQELARVPTQHPETAPEAMGSWWAGAPFEPIGSLMEDEEDKLDDRYPISKFNRRT
jgi:hypothetical protein